MPRVMLTESQRRAARVRKLFADGKNKIGFTDEQIGQILGVKRDTVRRYREHPEALYEKLVNLGKAMAWTDEDWLSVWRAK